MDSATLVEAIKRFSATIHGEADLKAKLDSGKPLRVKYGIDPTAPDVHLGHTVPLRLLRAFQDLGHKAVIIVGNATAKVGDPSGRDETRAVKPPDQIKSNAKKYMDQIGKIVKVEDAEVHLNGNWFDTVNFDGLLTLLSKFTVQQILTRDDFAKRMAGNVPISLHELLYPIMQGYDSVMMETDVEIGGTEQLFNMNMGRDMQRMWNQSPQAVITLPILRGTDGVRRMGKSLGNYIGINEVPSEMYAKVMSIPDDLMREWFALLTDVCQDAVESFFVMHQPRDVKKLLASHIVRQYHGMTASVIAGDAWTAQFTNRSVPDVIEEVFLTRAAVLDEHGSAKYATLLKEMGLAASNNDARRLIEQNAVSSLVDGEFVKVGPSNVAASIKPVDGEVIKVGRKIRKLRLV